jgi:NadR type nicotinamide-nucleotide adenylyltransferase
MIASMKKIVITGPESTGKSVLTRQLANYYQALYIPEYAREYIEELNRPYNYNDIEHIAHRQIADLEQYKNKATGMLFLDTYLIITKVWFDVVYKSCPQWVIDQINKKEIDLYLLCKADLPWEPDNVRENGGAMRDVLFEKYKENLESFGLNYRIISGEGNERLENAVFAINSFFVVPQ